MDPQQIFCHNPDCQARGKVCRGNIGVHSRKPIVTSVMNARRRLPRAKERCSTVFAIRVMLSRGSSRYWLMGVRFRQLSLRLAQLNGP